MVERGQPAGSEALERLFARHERRQQERLEQAVVVAEGGPFWIAEGQCLKMFQSPMLGFQGRQQLLVVEPGGIFEMPGHFRTESLGTVGDQVEEIADGNQITHFERVALLDEQLHQHPDGGAITLQHAGDGDECADERGSKRIDLPKLLLVIVGGLKDAADLIAAGKSLPERGIQAFPGRVILGLENAFLGDGREVSILERDLAEPLLPVLDGVTEPQLLGTGRRGTEQIDEVPLSCHEADDGNVAL